MFISLNDFCRELMLSKGPKKTLYFSFDIFLTLGFLTFVSSMILLIIKEAVFSKKKFSYLINIADFYFEKSAKLMINRIKEETSITNVKLKKLSKQNYRVYLGPFNNINSLQKSYNDISILNFENIEIIRND